MNITYLYREVDTHFPRVFKPETSQYNPDPIYSIRIELGDKDSPAYQAVCKTLWDACIKVYGNAEGEAFFNRNVINGKTAMIQRDKKSGTFYTTAKRKAKEGAPIVKNAEDHRVLEESDFLLTDGDICNVAVEFWLPEEKDSKGKLASTDFVSQRLRGLARLREGTPWTGGSGVASDEELGLGAQNDETERKVDNPFARS